MKKTMTAVALLLALTACGAGTSGTITEKEFEPGGTKVTCTGIGKKQKCKSSTTYDCWELELDDTTDICVSRETYDRVRVGEFFQS